MADTYLNDRPSCQRLEILVEDSKGLGLGIALGIRVRGYGFRVRGLGLEGWGKC